MNSVYNYKRNVNPHFYDVWFSQKPYIILKGGRNSFKSSVISQRILASMYAFIAKGEKANVVVVRKVGNTLRNSVYRQITTAMEWMGVTHEFDFKVSPLSIIHKGTGSTIYFYGGDDYQKLKSDAVGNLIAVWYEEAAEFKSQEEFEQSNVTFMRQKHELAPFVRFYWSYNPPRNPYSWINEWAEEMKFEDDYLVHSSTYLDDELGFATKQTLENIERIKRNDPDYYRYLYLGEAIGMGTNIYNMNLFHTVDEVPDNDPIMDVCYSSDIGHQTSATSVQCWGISSKGNVYLLNMYYYSPHGKARKKAPSELSKDVHDFVGNNHNRVYKYTIDSAEGGFRNQYYKDYGVMWHGVAKKEKHIMIDFTHTLLAQGRVFILKRPENEIFLQEVRRYEWDEKTVHSDRPQPIKEHDHSVDSFQYFVMDNLRRLELKM